MLDLQHWYILRVAIDSNAKHPHDNECGQDLMSGGICRGRKVKYIMRDYRPGFRGLRGYCLRCATFGFSPEDKARIRALTVGQVLDKGKLTALEARDATD